MSINITCDNCEEELKELGAILLSPPDEDMKVKKFHLCRKCYEKILVNMNK